TTEGRSRSHLDPYPPNLFGRPVGQGRRDEESADTTTGQPTNVAWLPVPVDEGRIVRRPLTHDQEVEQPTTRPPVRMPWPALVLYGAGQVVLAYTTVAGRIEHAMAWQVFAVWAVCGACLIAANTISNRARARR
ncbi:hypothetical protein, partial [Okeania sp. SIO2B9]|uniref:hypothetical protein n=1 Tax=Okeania sp. SIO2B9 TaxID=2607782 RepID=UPI00257C0B5C